MSPSEELFHHIVTQIDEAKEGKMFGALCIKAPNGKASAMLYDDNMVFKLEGEALREALSWDGAQLFDPMGGRPMGGWVQLPYTYAGQWPEIAQQSFDHVKQLKK